MFQKAKNTAVFGGTFIVTNEEIHEGLNGRQILSQSPYVIHGAIHDSGQRYPPSECHPGTREDILNIALDWVDKPLGESKSQIFWLSGPAGVGKTAIAQSLCQRLKELGRLGGDFFLSRSVAGHSDLHTLFPTLAYQLAEIYPQFGQELDVVIKTNESVLTKNMGLQLEQLIINPLKRATHNKSDIPLVVLIDGLDEAGGERDQTLLLRLLESGFVGYRLPLKIILTSRPEPWIKSAFSTNPLVGSTRCRFLHRTSQTDNDIRNFLEFGFSNIRKTHDLMKSRPVTWPSSEVIDDIVDRASGQFIYASTLLRYIEDPNGNPAERLHWVVEKPSTRFINSPFLGLDNLYKHVLSTSSNLDRTLTILGAVIASFQTFDSPLTFSSALSSVVDLELDGRPVSPLQLDPDPDSGRISPNGASSFYQSTSETISFPIDRIERILGFRISDGLLALRTIQSLVDISSSMELGVKFYHKSFQDFLLDPNRSGEYFIDISQVYSKLMVGTLRLTRDFEQCKTMSGQEGICWDLRTIEPRWIHWWLYSAASEQDRLLTEVKNLDRITFYRNYTWNIARKAPFVFVKTTLESNLWEGSGNIAESLAREINTRNALTLFLEKMRFLTVKTVFGKHIRQALDKF